MSRCCCCTDRTPSGTVMGTAWGLVASKGRTGFLAQCLQLPWAGMHGVWGLLLPYPLHWAPHSPKPSFWEE